MALRKNGYICVGYKKHGSVVSLIPTSTWFYKLDYSHLDMPFEMHILYPVNHTLAV
jgi:hypothetical protein